MKAIVVVLVCLSAIAGVSSASSVYEEDQPQLRHDLRRGLKSEGAVESEESKVAQSQEGEAQGGIFQEAATYGSFKGLPAAQEWTAEKKAKADEVIAALEKELTNSTPTASLLVEALAYVCNPLLRPVVTGDDPCLFWKPYRNGEKRLTEFFHDWMYYTPIPPTDEMDPKYHRDISGPGYYIMKWDALATTAPGKELVFNDKVFHEWMKSFLDNHGAYLDTPESFKKYPDSDLSPLDLWEAYGGTDIHPFDINKYVIPEGGFETYGQFFLRELKAGTRPLGGPDRKWVIDSPCDCGAFYIIFDKQTLQDTDINAQFQLPGKLGDTFGVVESIPGYGYAFSGGKAVDFLLWFTDYHHFHSPVTGKVLMVADIPGSWDYGFSSFDPNNPYLQSGSDSDIVNWYKTLDKHRRIAIVIDAGPEIGLVGMIPVGFWGVGSMKVYIKQGDEITKGDHIGHFLYAGSSIVLTFEPGKDFSMVVNGMEIGQAQFPRLVEVKQQIAQLVA